MRSYAIIGAGLAGCECALTLSAMGFSVTLFEQKPQFFSAAHASPLLAELVCSNSLRSNELTSGVGLLKEEMRALGSSIMAAADKTAIPAGKALAVDRVAFAEEITRRIKQAENITLVCRQAQSLREDFLREAGPDGIVIATGPMAAEGLVNDLREITGEDNCYFYDAIAPVIWSDSLDMDIVFRASRYAQGEEAGDYLNCPMNRAEYETFHAALCAGETFRAREFENEKHFEGCMPIEALAARVPKTLVFGPMKPVGLVDPRTGSRPWAVLQLRPEQANMRACNLVGCQTKLLQREQERIFRLVPGLEQAEFARFGSMHRNTYVNAPRVLNPDLSLKKLAGVYLAGQISGVEGYVESAASGLWLAYVLAAKARGIELDAPPPQTALGALLAHLQRPVKNFQPSNITFGLMPEPEEKIKKKDRKLFYASRAGEYFKNWLDKTSPAGC